MTESPTAHGGLRFLEGRWRGEGTLRGRPVTSVSECRPSAQGGGALSMRVATFRDGTVIHEEDILWMFDSGRAVRCVTRPQADAEQVWRIRESEPGAWELTHPAHRWTIRRAPDGHAYDETFDTAGPDGAMRPGVVLHHVRVAHP